MPSLFTAATKRAPLGADTRDPAEDRLTEILAVVLERAPEAARTLVESWIGEWAHGEVTVQPQKRTGGNRHIDLEIRFQGPEPASPTLVWVEIKRDSKQSGPNQLWGYANDLRALLDKTCAKGHLVFLTRPRDWREEFSLQPTRSLNGLWPPKDVTWPKTSAHLARWALETNENLFQSELVREFVDYLEEEHVATDGLRLEGAIVLQRFEETDEAFATLLKETELKLGKSDLFALQEQTSRLTGGGWKECYWTYTPRDQERGLLDLEWNFKRRKSPGPSRSCFAAGLTWRDPRAESPWAHVLERLGDRSILLEFEQYTDDLPRLYRWLQPEVLAAQGALDYQVDYLANWVTKTFETLVDAWPPY